MDASYSSPGYEGFQFQPPLPPGSPRNATPPPLPRGTPPCTPPNFTPPQPPGSTPPPLLRNTPPPHDSTPSRIEDEDTLTLEELEEQQRLIWAALEQADSANSDSDVAAGTSVAGNSVASSPSRTESDVLPEAACKKGNVLEAAPPSQSEPAPEAEPLEQMQVSADDLVDLTEEDPGPADSEVPAESGPSALTCEANHGEGGGGSPAVTGADAPFKNASPVPDMSKFAAGITPFEFENMAESSGVYLRIRSVLKNSPRNQLKNKKPSV